jgi:hypothetical protein
MEYKYDSEALQVMHEEWLDMHRCGDITDEELQEIEEIIFGEDDETDPEAEESPEEEEETA